jgi:hypothetical protein
MRDLRTLVIGLLLGACLVLAMGQAAAPQRRERYEVTPTTDANGNFAFFVHDRETDKVYHRKVASWDLPAAGVTVEQILQKNN